MTYADSSPWPDAADGAGAHLSLIDLNLDNSLASSWVASYLSVGFQDDEPLQATTNLYPNPATSIIYIENQNLKVKECRVYDVFGRMVLNGHYRSHSINFPIDQLATGSYVIKVVFEDNTSLFKSMVKN